jgi:hypothetical protein
VEGVAVVARPVSKTTTLEVKLPTAGKVAVTFYNETVPIYVNCETYGRLSLQVVKEVAEWLKELGL